jgi:hypothetical protein
MKEREKSNIIRTQLTVVSFYLLLICSLSAKGAHSKTNKNGTKERTERERTEWKIWYYSVNKPIERTNQ